MSEEHRRTHNYWLLGAAAMSVLAVYAFFAFERPNELDTRPMGNVDDIAQLAQRDDVNVLYILIDTLRSHRLGSYGYERDTSPNLSYLAGTGVRFHNHLAQSTWTKTSMASLWTGLYPIRTGVLRFPHAAPPEATLPAEIFREAGYRTAGIWRNGWVAPNFGFDQGFDFYHRPVGHAKPAGFRSENPNISLEGSDHDVVDAAHEFLRVNAANRWFLYVHLMDVHQYLYNEDTAVFGSDYSDIYDNSILHEDGIVLRLIAALATGGLLDKTLVVVSSDHGEAFRERGLEGHARHVYRESTEVPFIISFPFRLRPPGITVHQPSRNIDVWPTLLDLLGLPELPDVDGRSLVPEILASGHGELLESPAEPGIAHLDRNWARFEQPPKPALAVTDGRYRLIHEINPHSAVREELFALGSDPQELTDVLEQEPEAAERLRELVRDYIALPPAWETGVPVVEIDQMERNQLRALGYALP